MGRRATRGVRACVDSRRGGRVGAVVGTFGFAPPVALARLHDAEHSGAEGKQGDDELGDIAERGVEQPAQRLVGVQRQLLRHIA